MNLPDMERCNRIIQNALYQEYYHKNEMAEADRRFCHHDMVHFLDVARLGMILSLRENIVIPEDILYAATLLHDIGRWVQYQDGTDHALASSELAPAILQECGYDSVEQNEILEAIRAHRNSEVATEASLRGILYRADKLSRSCFACGAEKECNWKGDKKNLELKL